MKLNECIKKTFVPFYNSQITPSGLSLPIQDFQNDNCKHCEAFRDTSKQYAEFLGVEERDALEFSNKIWEFESKLAEVSSSKLP